MTVQTEFVGGLPQLRIIVGPVDIVACCTCHAMAVHDALNEIVALHAILMCSTVGEMEEVGFSKRDVFKLPVVRQTKTDAIAHRPVIDFALNEANPRPPLRVALNAGVV